MTLYKSGGLETESSRHLYKSEVRRPFSALYLHCSITPQVDHYLEDLLCSCLSCWFCLFQNSAKSNIIAKVAAPLMALAKSFMPKKQ